MLVVAALGNRPWRSVVCAASSLRTLALLSTCRRMIMRWGISLPCRGSHLVLLVSQIVCPCPLCVLLLLLLQGFSCRAVRIVLRPRVPLVRQVCRSHRRSRGLLVGFWRCWRVQLRSYLSVLYLLLPVRRSAIRLASFHLCLVGLGRSSRDFPWRTRPIGLRPLR